MLTIVIISNLRSVIDRKKVCRICDLSKGKHETGYANLKIPIKQESMVLISLPHFIFPFTNTTMKSPVYFENRERKSVTVNR